MKLTMVILGAAMLFALSVEAETTVANPLISSENTIAHEVDVKTIRYKGYDSLQLTVSSTHKSIEENGCDNCTFLELENIDFTNGTIELEVASHPTENAPNWARGFVGIVFRVQGMTYEGVYLRPLNAIAENQLQRNHSVQYFSYPDHPWHLLRKETPGQYESYAPIKPSEWTHMKLEVKGRVMKLYLDHMSEPSLVVTDLKLGASQKGTIGLFTEPETVAYFRNLVVTYND